ncbi:hypothetical protein AVEN_256439-1 [Araneus ventricosus]|uniref:Uncharacterized protein n=1 Tax=Araneus ventricosus TaxID=182803 RepID=A0A4Y2LSQ2_ARAVE|nr:hypothetical protein AVEN_256439-1 [Araneus ventricosus]
MSISQTRRLPPARTTFFPYLFLPLTQSTCRSLWNEESVSERGVRIRKGSTSPNPNGETESLTRNRFVPFNGFVPFGRTRVLWFLLRIRIFG